MGIGYNPRVVTNGLLLCFDAANIKSYPGSGTSWFDLSGKGNTGTLTNGPTFESSNGAIVLDGTDDFVTTSLSSYTPYCVDIWFYNDDNIGTSVMQGNYQILLGLGSYAAGITLGAWTGAATNETFCFFGLSGNGMTYIRDTAAVGTHNFVANWNGSTYDIWLDGSKRTTYPDSGAGHCTLHARNSCIIGKEGSGSNSYEFDGKIYRFSIYDSQLTDNQISSNFNAMRSRYGI